MTQPPRFTRHRFVVFLGNAEDESTVTEHHVVAIGADVQRVEALFAGHGWGEVSKRPITAAAAMAYYALVRTGAFTGTFAEFEGAYIEVQPEGQQTVNPTDAAPSPA